MNAVTGVLLLAGVCLAGCGGSTPPKQAGPKSARWVEPLSIGPISYFNAQCASCHGEYGSEIFEHPIAKESDDAAYRAMVEYMVVERSKSSLPERDLDAQTSYCASLATGAVFVCIKTPVMEGGLEGEVTPGSTVTLQLEKAGLQATATVSGHGWAIGPREIASLKQSSGEKWVDAVLVARGPKGDVRRLRIAEHGDGAFSAVKLPAKGG